MNNVNLNNAKRAKNDEFYTELSDIEDELVHYKDCFDGKVVYCNCDDPEDSNFFKYFVANFKSLGLKKLIATCYKSRTPDLFGLSRMPAGDPVSVEYTMIGSNSVYKYKILKRDGDFRSAECVAFLKQSDIVVTNPPFSLFREYMDQLVKYDKKFLVIGSMPACSYPVLFPLMSAERIWFGRNNKSMRFRIPEHYKKDGVEKAKVNVAWYTNLGKKVIDDPLVLNCKYDPDKYPRYDKIDAINVNVLNEIPIDYKGWMGVPVTFMLKYDSSRFEMVEKQPDLIRHILNDGKIEWTRFVIKGKVLFERILIKHKLN